MIGFILGAAFGAFSLFCLNRATRAIVSGDAKKAALPLLGNVASIGAPLLLAAFFIKDQIMHTGIGVTVVLVVGAVTIFVVRAKKSR